MRIRFKPSGQLGIVIAAAAVAAMATGCSPTKAGIEARSQAAQRMSAVSAQIHYGQAKQSFESGQLERALREIKYAIEIYSESAEFHVLHGRISLETHKLEEAIKSFQTAMEKNPKFADPHYFAGIVYQRWSNDREAHESYMKAFELEPTRVQYLLAAAESLIALGEYEPAKQLIQPKLEYFEHNAALRQLQGQIALLQGDPKLAASLYTEARLLSPDDNILLEELVWAQFAAEMYPDCHETVTMLQGRIGALPDGPKHSAATHKDDSQRPDLHHVRARCLAMMGRGSEARELYIELTRQRPADVTAWSELGALCWELGDYRRVAECSVQLISLAPARYEGYMLKGINERHKGNMEAAVELFTQAAQRAGDMALPHLLLGQALEKQGDVAGARVAYTNALAAQPGSTEAQELLRRLNEGQRLSAAPMH